MATNPEEIQEEPQEAPEQQEEPAPEPQQDETPAEVASLAQRMGWVPREQYTGPADNWKPAEQFILDGRDIQRETARELKAVRSQIEIIGKTSASIIEQQVNDRVAQLTERYNNLVEDGNGAEAFKVAEQITALKTQPVTAQPSGSPPETQDWVQRNSWFNQPGNEGATYRAQEICANLASKGYPNQAQLQAAEQQIRKEYPELFKQQANGKPAPGVNAPTGRTAGSSNREKGFADMPAEAQTIARDMVARGVIAKLEDYTKNYWLNAGSKQ